jgi:hypothetical protein
VRHDNKQRKKEKIESYRVSARETIHPHHTLGFVIMQSTHTINVPVGIDDVEDSLEFWVHLSLLHHGEVVAQRTQAGFELVVIQLAALILVKVPARTTEKMVTVKPVNSSPAK